MLRNEKQAVVEGLKDRFKRMISTVFVDYQGLDVASVTELRDILRAHGVEYQVVKNTLTKLAVAEAPYAADLNEALTGMTAIAWSYEEPAAAALVFKEFTKKNKNLRVKAGLIDGRVIDGATVVSKLAVMPGKNELRAQLLATLQAPAQQLLRQLLAPSQNFVYLLKARQEAAAFES